MSGKSNYADFKPRDIDRLVTFAFRVHETFQINTEYERKELGYNYS